MNPTNYRSNRALWAQLDEDHRMRVLNKKYWPHHVQVEKMMEAERWCYEHFKSSQWRNVGTYFAFKSGPDATAFALRWA